MISYGKLDADINLAEFSVEKARAVMNDLMLSYQNVCGAAPNMDAVKKIAAGETFGPSFNEIRRTYDWVNSFKKIMIRLDIVNDYVIKADDSLKKVAGMVTAASEDSVDWIA